MHRYTQKKKDSPNQQQTVLYDTITKIQADILCRIQKLKATTSGYMCEHFSIADGEIGREEYDPGVNYYDRCWKRWLINEVGREKVKIYREVNANFQSKLLKINALFDKLQALTSTLKPFLRTRKKRKGNDDNENDSKSSVECPLCAKRYPQLITLNIHIRTKHRNYNMEENGQEGQNVQEGEHGEMKRQIREFMGESQE